MKLRILFDTNVLVYGIDRLSSFHDPTKNIFDIRLGVQAIQAKAEIIATYNKADFKEFQSVKVLRPEEIEC
jgi:predicted nucleic acid-binding protein